MYINKVQIEPLIKLGLSKTQAILYLTSLKYGMLSALELSKKSGINRQQVYADAEKLIYLGLYDITKRQGRKYIPAAPSQLKKLGERRAEETSRALAEITSALPHLESLSRKKKQKATIKHYEGMENIHKAYQAELAEAKNTEVLSFAGSIETIFQHFPEQYWQTWNTEFVKHHSKSKMLVHKSAEAEHTAKHDGIYKRETRWINQLPLRVNIDVFNDSVLLVSFEDEMATWIESSAVADSYRMLFNSLWPEAKQFGTT